MDKRDIHDLTTATAYDRDGEKLGSVKQVYVNDSTGQPDFVEVGHGLFGMSSSLVPLRGHQLSGQDLRLAFSKDRIKDAPNIEDDTHLSEEDHDLIYRHYELEGAENLETYNADFRDNERDLGTDRAAAGAAGGAAGVGGGAAFDRKHDQRVDAADVRETEQDRLVDRDAAGVAGERADTGQRTDDVDSMVLSEERLNVDKERVETGKVRLRKYVVHDTETVEVPVQREEVHVERTPVDADDTRRGLRGEGLGEDEVSVTLSEEHANVTKETVPVEEVSLSKETVRDTETVHEDVAREELDVDGVDGDIDDPNLRR